MIAIDVIDLGGAVDMSVPATGWVAGYTVSLDSGPEKDEIAVLGLRLIGESRRLICYPHALNMGGSGRAAPRSNKRPRARLNASLSVSFRYLRPSAPIVNSKDRIEVEPEYWLRPAGSVE